MCLILPLLRLQLPIQTLTEKGSLSDVSSYALQVTVLLLLEGDVSLLFGDLELQLCYLGFEHRDLSSGRIACGKERVGILAGCRAKRI
jgi:hypothetical protein